MSLGYTSVHPIERGRQGSGVENIRSTSSRKGPQSSSTSPLKIRIEVLERALSILSKTSQEFTDKVMHSKLFTSLEDDGEEGELSLEERIGAMEDKLNTLTYDSSLKMDLDHTRGLASNIRATVNGSGTEMFPIMSRSANDDVKNTSRSIQVPKETTVRLYFPQETLSDGRVCMSAICVDQSMNLSSGWLVVCNTHTGDCYVSNVRV